MSDFETIKLGDVATYINGYPFKPEDRGSEGLPIIRIQDLTGNSYDLGFYNGTYPERIEINDGDILISWSGSLGVYKWNNGKALLNQHIFKVVFDKKPIDQEFFIFAVKYKLKEMASKTHGATMKHIVKKDFDNTRIPFPPLSEQKLIAKKLLLVQSMIEKHNETLSKLDDLIKARFVEMFRNEHNENVPLINLIFAGAGLSYGIVVPGNYCERGIPMIRPSDFINRGLYLDKVYRVSPEIENKYKRTRLEGNELLVQVIGQPGQIMLADERCKGMNVTRNLAVIRIDPQMANRIYVMEYMKTREAQAFMLGATKQSTLKQLPLKNLRELPIPVIDICKQNEFADFVAQVDKSKSAVQKSLDETQLLFDSLMQEYFG